MVSLVWGACEIHDFTMETKSCVGVINILVPDLLLGVVSWLVRFKGRVQSQESNVD